MSDDLGDAPVEITYRDVMNALATAIDDVLNHGRPRDTGFILMVFPIDKHEGRCNYISTANRADVIVLLKEQLSRFEGMPDVKGNA